MPSPANTRFAVAAHVLTYLGSVRDEGRAVGSDELAESARVTPVHVRRVMGPLRRAGLVRSRSGQQGGWTLESDPRDIPLVAVYDALRADEHVLAMHDPSPACPVGRVVKERLDALDAELVDGVRARLRGVTVADLVPEG